MNLRTLPVVLALYLLAAACSKPATPPDAQPKPVETTQPAPGPAPIPVPAHVAPPVAALFPAKDTTFAFKIEDTNLGKAGEVTEQLIREENRVIAVQEGNAYAAWHIRADGVWRLDPKGSGKLLRYLPAEPADAVWRHGEPADPLVRYFRLFPVDTCPGAEGGACWMLSIVGRDEQTSFTFAAGLGPTTARTEHLTSPDLSFTKQVRSVTPAALTADARSAALTKGDSGTAPMSPVLPATVDEYVAFETEVTQAVRAVELDGDGRPEFLPSPPGRWTTSEYGSYIHDAAGNRFSPALGQGVHRMQAIKAPEWKRSLLLVEEDAPHNTFVLIEAHPTADTRKLRQLTTGADRFRFRGQVSKISYDTPQSATLEVDWDPGEKVPFYTKTLFRVTDTNQGFQWEQISTGGVDRAGWKYPDTAERLVEEAMMAWIYAPSLTARYFATPEAAAKLLEKEPEFAPGIYGRVDVRLKPKPAGGWVTRGFCTRFETQPGGEVSASDFFWRWDYTDSNCAAYWGHATFTHGADHRLLLEALTIESVYGVK